MSQKAGEWEAASSDSSMAELPTGKHWSVAEGVDGMVPQALSSSRA